MTARITRSAPPLDRDHRPPLPSASPAPQLPFEVQHFGRGAEPEPQKGIRRRKILAIAGLAYEVHAFPWSGLTPSCFACASDM
jgi:hypothetical protein